MLDIRLIRENPDIVKADLRRRGDEEKIGWVDNLLELDRNWRKLQTDVNSLRERRNRLTEEIAKLRRGGRDPTETVRLAEAIPDQIKKVENEAGRIREEINRILMLLPNLMHETVPYGKSEEDSVEIRRSGKIRDFDFKPKDHIDVGIDLGLIDLERAARVAGARFYYLRGDLVKLNQALLAFGLDFSLKKGFRIFQTPYMLRRDVVEGATALQDFVDAIYKIQDEDLYLIPTSEYALLALHKDEILEGDQLPLRYGGISPCFRKEAGAHGRDTKGIFRVHQFEKIEQFIFCKPEDSWKQHELLIQNAEELWQTLEIPYRIVNACTGDLGTVAAKKYDLEAWLPGQGKFREVVSCSNCTSYQAARSNIRYRDKPSEPTRYVHTLNSTLIATERALVALLENYQQKDGSVNIPKVLQPCMNGQEKLRAEN